MTASVLQQLLASYFAIIYSWQLSSSENNSSIYLKYFTDLDFFFPIFFLVFSFFLTNACLPCQLRKAYAVTWAANRFVVWRHLNTILLTNFENLNPISNIFQETHDYVVLKDPVIIYIYLRTIDRHFRDQGNVHHP